MDERMNSHALKKLAFICRTMLEDTILHPRKKIHLRGEYDALIVEIFSL